MATNETRVKQKLDRRDKKIELLSKLPYRRLTFGPFSSSGLPDRLVSFGSATVGIEVKAEGKKLTKLQEHKLAEGVTHGVPSFGLIGDTGVDVYYQTLMDYFSEDRVEERMIAYERDCLALREALEELI